MPSPVRSPSPLFPLVVFTFVALVCAASGADSFPLKFDFGPGSVAPGYTQVLPDMVYAKNRGFGFEPGAKVVGVDRGGDALRGDFVTSDAPFHFSARVPAEGNYRVMVTLGDAAGESTTTIRAELRRLMVERVHTARGKFQRVSFIVATRTPAIAAGGDIKAGEVRLKAPRETIQEAWAWDDAITLEFNGARPAVCAVEIEPASVPTIFLLGDSTVCDQSKEPYNSWGQMLPRFFKPEVAVSNHAESGETYRDSIGRRRLDKILSVMQPGDWLFMQFGHNDQKQIASHSGGPFTTYPEEIRRHVAGVRAHGGTPVIISPMERRGFDEAGKVRPSLIEYAQAAGQVAKELGVAFIDLNAMSKALYEALGPEKSAQAFAAPDGKVDNTHHNNFGSYELARCIARGIVDAKLPLADDLVYEFRTFNPAKPDDPKAFTVPPSPHFTNQRPLGD